MAEHQAVANRLRARWAAYYRSRAHPGQYRARRRRLVIAIAEVKALDSSVYYFGDFIGRTNPRTAETIATRSIGFYTMRALRAANIRRKQPPRSSFGGPQHPVVRVIHEWLATIMRKPPGREHLAKSLRGIRPKAGSS